MRKINNQTKYPDVKITDVQEVTEKFFEEEVDMVRMIKEVQEAEKVHEYTKKAFTGWTSLPLRSLGGMTGEDASDSVGEHASTDFEKFKDTIAMQPYTKSVIESVGGKLLKVRLMKMMPYTSIGEHKDNFKGDGVVVRFHVPLITHKKVTFKVNGRPYHLEQGKLYKIDVSQRHAVINNSPIERIHLVFDVVTDEAVRQKLNEK